MVFRIYFLRTKNNDIILEEVDRDFTSFDEAYDFGVKRFGKKGFRLHVGGLLRGWDIKSFVKAHERTLRDY